jgi:hypothetical protein
MYSEPRSGDGPGLVSNGWSTPREALRVCLCRRSLCWTGSVALVVGTILSLINQSGVILAGEATSATWARVGANYLVPFCVSNVGLLAGARRQG